MSLWGYSELSDLLLHKPGLKNGVIVDTNILISATYELDDFYEETSAFVELLIQNKIPMFCNVNVRSEFLEIHRRIIFSEAILDFEHQVDKTKLPATLAGKLTTYRSQYERKLKSKPDEAPKRLGEREIKDFKLEMAQVQSSKNDLWTELCENQVASQLIDIWNETEADFGLNTLSLREEDQKKHLNQKPDWDNAVALMSKHGLASSDAMIVNIFLSSKFEAIVSSDTDIGISIKKENRHDKICILPDLVKAKLKSV